MANYVRLSGFSIFFIPALLLVFLSCGSGGEKEEKLSSEMTELVRYYHEMKAIGLTGNVEKFLSMRDSLTNAEIAAYYERKGWTLDSAKVSGWTFNWPDVAGLPVYQDTTYELWRRVVFWECGMFDKEGKEQCVYSIIMFRKNGDEWKVGSTTRLATYRYDENSEPVKLHKYLFHKMFRLPPSFIDLYPREGPSQIEPRPIEPRLINPEDTVKKKR